MGASVGENALVRKETQGSRVLTYMRVNKGAELSRRQRQCLQARRQRLTAKETARALNISPHTVAMHWRLARLKIEAQRVSQVVVNRQSSGDAGSRVFLESKGAVVFRYLGFAALAFGLFSIVMTLLGWLLLYFSPWFAHLWR